MAKQTIKIVLVEDDVVLSDMYLKKFTLEGYDVQRAVDGDEGLALIRKVKPQLVLLDIMMPQKNGLDVLKDMKADPDLQGIYVVLLSNVADQTYVEEGMRLGANRYLMKSDFTPHEVVEKIQEWASEIAA